MITETEIDPLISVRNPMELLTVPPIILQIGTVTEKLSRHVTEQIALAHHTGQPVLPMVINSRGGDAYAMFAIIDAMLASQVPIATICTGKGFSSGALIFACGAQGMRYMAPNAALMIHEVKHEVGANTTHTANDTITNAGELKRLNDQAAALLAKRTGKPKRTFTKHGDQDWYLNAHDAVKLGIADHIGIPTLVTRVQVSMSLERP